MARCWLPITLFSFAVVAPIWPVQAAEVSTLGQARYDADRQVIILPYRGPAPRATYFRLSGKHHYYDLGGARLAKNAVQHHRLSGALSRYTVGPREKGTVRVSFELATNASPAIRTEAAAHRLVLLPFGRERSAAKLGVRVPRGLALPSDFGAAPHLPEPGAGPGLGVLPTLLPGVAPESVTPVAVIPALTPLTPSAPPQTSPPRRAGATDEAALEPVAALPTPPPNPWGWLSMFGVNTPPARPAARTTPTPAASQRPVAAPSAAPITVLPPRNLTIPAVRSLAHVKPVTLFGRPEGANGGLWVPFRGPAPEYEVKINPNNPRWLYFEFEGSGLSLIGKRFGVLSDPALEAWMYTQPAGDRLRLYVRRRGDGTAVAAHIDRARARIWLTGSGSRPAELGAGELQEVQPVFEAPVPLPVPGPIDPSAPADLGDRPLR